MPPKATEASGGAPKKRKEPPQSSANGRNHNGRERAPKRVKVQNARAILTQSSDAALSNGELDLQAFLKAREFEIKALEDGMKRSKGALTTRAFQQVPRDLRRRTASHNVKRVPKRLQKRAAREMREDNTPTVTASKRKPGSSRGRIRAENAKRLGLLAQKKATKRQGTEQGSKVGETDTGVVGRIPRPKVKKGTLNDPPKPPSKFRKRQIHKSWLPTHIYHAKRAKMTEPKKPLWRFAIPITPTQKSYRPSHRAGNARGALCWDTSYMSTIGLEGSELALEKVLRAVGIIQDEAWGAAGRRWREGKRIWNGWLRRDDKGHMKQVAPATVIWCYAATPKADEESMEDADKRKTSRKPPLRQLFVRVHPAAFLELWNELLRIAKMQRPIVHVEDLRFEIGSLELTGPSSTEALLGILQPYEQSTNPDAASHLKTFRALSSVTNPASLPRNALLTLSAVDPRLRYPPQKIKAPRLNEEEAFAALENLAAWPADQSSPSPFLFDREYRFKATRLASQKSINRRKRLAPPGEYVSITVADQPIPILLYVSRTSSSSTSSSSNGQGTWTLLAPWKCILPIWYCLMHYPLSTGGNPRFGGLQELQQMRFESGTPWFPADFPGTRAGWAWEIDEQERRRRDWDRKPKGRRAEFDSLDLGRGRRGEIGIGWACDFEKLLDSKTADGEDSTMKSPGKDATGKDDAKLEPLASLFQQISGTAFTSLLSNPKLDILPASLVTIRITLFSRGVPIPCARIYRLPRPQVLDSTTHEEAVSNRDPRTTSTPSLRDQWLALAPSTGSSKTKSKSKIQHRTPLSSIPPHLRQRALAQSLLATPPITYPLPPTTRHPHVPDASDIIGFVTTGNFNLAEGKGTALGCIVVERVVGGLREGLGKERGGGGLKREDRFCIVRNAGEGVGRLGLWDVV